MTLTETYKKNYLPGFDCRMTTFRNNLAFYGNNLSNGMILGLSGCLSFIYATPSENRIPYYTILGVTDQTLEGLTSVFGTYLTRGEYTFQPASIKEFLTSNLDRNILVNAAINRPLLNHIRQGGEMKDFVVHPTNVGFHFVTITGVEDEIITFFETDYEYPLKCDIETFAHLWFYDSIHGRAIYDSNQMCNGKYYTIQHPSIEAHNKKNMLIYSIDKVTTSYFHGDAPIRHGLKGIESFFFEVQNLDTTIDRECLVNSIYFMKILEMNLSGGGFGRKLYSYFLGETSSLLEDQELRSIAAEFRSTGRLWSEFINNICSASVINNVMAGELEPLQSLAHSYSKEILQAETRQFHRLKNWVELK